MYALYSTCSCDVAFPNPTTVASSALALCLLMTLPLDPFGKPRVPLGERWWAPQSSLSGAVGLSFRLAGLSVVRFVLPPGQGRGGTPFFWLSGFVKVAFTREVLDIGSALLTRFIIIVVKLGNGIGLSLIVDMCRVVLVAGMSLVVMLFVRFIFPLVRSNVFFRRVGKYTCFFRVQMCSECTNWSALYLYCKSSCPSSESVMRLS